MEVRCEQRAKTHFALRNNNNVIFHSPHPNQPTFGPPVTVDLAPLIVITGKRPDVDVIGPQGLIFLLLLRVYFQQKFGVFCGVQSFENIHLCTR